MSQLPFSFVMIIILNVLTVKIWALQNLSYSRKPFTIHHEALLYIMSFPFGKLLIIGVGTLICVSCAIPTVRPPQPSAVPVDSQEKIIEIDKSQIQTPSEPIPSAPTNVAVIDRLQPATPPLVVAWLPASLLSLHNTPVVPGGIAWITLPAHSEIPPKIMYQKRRVLVLRQEQGWVALVGIPLSAKAGQHSVVDQQTGEDYSFWVENKKYKTQRLRIKNKRKVTPNRQDLQRIQRERKQILTALKTPWQITSTSPLPLMQPVKGRYSSPYGLRRYFNGQRRSPHRGLDIAAPLGTPVIAAAAGKVVLTGHYFFTGKTVFIDHGQGVVTLYGHLNSIVVDSEQIVKKGQIIGTVGKTGRATGPHLHWGVSLNNTMIDPMLVRLSVANIIAK